MSICVTDSAYNSDIQENDTSNSHSVKSKKISEVKLPPFLDDDPELWFTLADNTFSVYGIKQDMEKYLLILENLDLKYARMIRDEILKGQYDYNSLKKEIISKLREEMTEKLESEEIGDRTPKEFLRHLKSMAGMLVPESTLQIIWRDQLPVTVKAMVQLHPSRNLAQEVETAELVNGILTAMTKEKIKNQYVREIKKKVDSMAVEIEQLKQKISEMEGSDDSQKAMKRQRTESKTDENIAESPTSPTKTARKH